MHRIGKEKEELDKDNIPHRLLIHIHNIKPDSILPKKKKEIFDRRQGNLMYGLFLQPIWCTFIQYTM